MRTKADTYFFVSFIAWTFFCFFSMSTYAQEIRVHNKAGLLKALKTAKSGETIYVVDTAEINLSGEETLIIPTNVTLASGGGKGGEGGALLYTNTNGTMPLFRMSHKNGRITGLRIKGPDTGIYANGVNYFAGKSAQDKKINRLKYYRKNMYTVPVSQGIRVMETGAKIDHCELYGWTHAAIMILKEGKEVQISNNNIHHNRRFGLGYGVCLDKGSAVIYDNTFDFNRHSIAGTGKPGTSYEVYNNVFYKHHKNWAVDMHGGKDRKDGTNIAGTSIKVYDNVFYINYNPKRVLGVVIRGVPQKKAVIKNNTFYLFADSKKTRVKPTPVMVIMQTNAQGNKKVVGNEIIWK